MQYFRACLNFAALSRLAGKARLGQAKQGQNINTVLSVASIATDFGHIDVYDINRSNVIFQNLSQLCCFVHPSGQALRVIQFSPDTGQILTAGDDGVTCIWDIATRSLKR